jgi:hypothetical protein
LNESTSLKEDGEAWEKKCQIYLKIIPPEDVNKNKEKEKMSAVNERRTFKKILI